MTNEVEITILPNGKKAVVEKGKRLFEVLAEYGFFLRSDCAGKGTCGKCKVKLVSGSFEGATKDDRGFILSCKAKASENATIELVDSERYFEENFAVEEGETTLAVDIGTTTLVAVLVDKKSGKTLKRASMLNPQASLGADVISRIKAYREGKGETLTMLVRRAVSKLINSLMVGKDIKNSEVTVCANTTMLHIFAGEDPSSMGEYPFTPRFVDERVYSGNEVGLEVKSVRLLPSVSAFVGSDLTAGAVAVDIKKGNNLLVDLGTNGEVVLSAHGKLYATSTAAGPAFEGACIECGSGGIAGAIDSVRDDNGNLCFTTVDGEKAKSLCGSGLIDAVAYMLSNGIIDETGAFTTDEDKFYLTDEVYITQRDIREFQMAKSAICSGVETLLQQAGLKASEVDNLYLAGSLGLYLSVPSAVKTGLIPRSLGEKTTAVGNSALNGAVLASSNIEAIEKIKAISTETEVVDLSSSAFFNERYIDNMYFEE